MNYYDIHNVRQVTYSGTGQGYFQSYRTDATNVNLAPYIVLGRDGNDQFVLQSIHDAAGALTDLRISSWSSGGVSAAGFGDIVFRPDNVEAIRITADGKLHMSDFSVWLGSSFSDSPFKLDYDFAQGVAPISGYTPIHTVNWDSTITEPASGSHLIMGQYIRLRPTITPGAGFIRTIGLYVEMLGAYNYTTDAAGYFTGDGKVVQICTDNYALEATGDVTLTAGNLIMAGAGADDERLKLPYLTGVPASVDNGSIWMEADGLHMYYGGVEVIGAPDNLGDHTAIQDLNMAGFDIVNPLEIRYDGTSQSQMILYRSNATDANAAPFIRIGKDANDYSNWGLFFNAGGEHTFTSFYSKSTGGASASGFGDFVFFPDGVEKMRLSADGILRVGARTTDVNAYGPMLERVSTVGGEVSSRLFLNETLAAAKEYYYGVSLNYQGDAANQTLPSGAVLSWGNGLWGIKGHNNLVNGLDIIYGDRAATYVHFGSTIVGANQFRASSDLQHKIIMDAATDLITLHPGDDATDYWFRFYSAHNGQDMPYFTPHDNIATGRGQLGDNSYRWYRAYIYTVYRHGEVAIDEVDDLALIDAMDIQRDGKNEPIQDEITGFPLMDTNTMPEFLLSEGHEKNINSRMINSSMMSSLLRGSIKQLHQKVKDLTETVTLQGEEILRLRDIN